MKARTGLEPAFLTIRGVEFLDNLRDRKHWNALLLVERPTLEFLERVFPVGTIIETRVAHDIETA